MSAAPELIQLRELFASTHWAKGNWFLDTPDKRIFCAVGGLRLCLGEYPTSRPAGEVIAALYKRTLYAMAVHAAPLIDTGEENDEFPSDEVQEWLEALRQLGPETPLSTVEAIVIRYNDQTSTDLDGVLAMIDAAQEALTSAG